MKNNFENAPENISKEEIIRKKLLELVNAEDFDVFAKAQDKIVGFTEKLKEKYPDYQDYSFYHLMIGSTPKGECSKKDFPGEDSIEKLINSL